MNNKKYNNNNSDDCEEKDKENSDKTLDKTFFEDLWPVLLDENKCRVESNSVDYFVPSKKFNQLYWHTFLSKVGYPDYVKPHELRCCEGAKQQEASEGEAELVANETVKETTNATHGHDYENRGSLAIERVVNPGRQLDEKEKRMERLAHSFANRVYPWTMETPKLGFELTTQLRECFNKPMEMNILQDIHTHNCQLMIIDAGNEICVEDFQRWIKFRPYIQMLALVRCHRVERRLHLLNVFHTLLVEESMENSWHDELQCSLHCGFEHAKNIHLIKDCSNPLVFVFSQCRGFCTCDTYKIVRRS